KAGTTDTAKVSDAIIGLSVPNLTGGNATMLANHHITKPVVIGEIQDNGQFDVVWETEKEVKGDAWSDFLPTSEHLVSDWTAPIMCGSYNTQTKVCLGGEAK
ncbi:MAG: transporter substrate-binding protein, partial [Vibrio casei]